MSHNRTHHMPSTAAQAEFDARKDTARMVRVGATARVMADRSPAGAVRGAYELVATACASQRSTARVTVSLNGESLVRFRELCEADDRTRR